MEQYPLKDRIEVDKYLATQEVVRQFILDAGKDASLAAILPTRGIGTAGQKFRPAGRTDGTTGNYCFCASLVILKARC